MKKLFFLSLFCVVVNHAMDRLEYERQQPYGALCSLLHQDVGPKYIRPLLSYTELARLKQVSKGCNELYDIKQVCPDFRGSSCSTYACKCLAENYYLCTKALAHFSRKNDKGQFRHLWVYHEVLRNNNMAFLGCSAFTIQDQMSAYDKYYSDERMCKSRTLEQLYIEILSKNVCAAKTIISAGSLHARDLIKNYQPLPSNATIESCSFEDLIHQACRLNDADFIYLLLGKSIEASDIKYIMYRAPFKLINELLDRNMLNIAMKTKSEKTLLHYAAEYGFVGVIKKLVAKGMYVNGTTKKGMTPLHYAARNVHVDAVSELCKHVDIDPRITNNAGKTALDYVKMNAFESRGKKNDKKAIKILLLTTNTENHVIVTSGKKKYKALG